MSTVNLAAIPFDPDAETTATLYVRVPRATHTALLEQAKDAATQAGVHVSLNQLLTSKLVAPIESCELIPSPRSGFYQRPGAVDRARRQDEENS